MRGNILILQVQVPFTRGGAEVLCETLAAELRKRDFRVDLVSLPFSALPKQRILKHMIEWRMLELEHFAGHEVDLVIATKFPSYLVPHKNKITWLIHQHRQAYELYGTRFGDFEATAEDEALRQMILKGDRESLSSCQRLFTISPNVSARLDRYLGLKSEPLLPPLPLGDNYYRDTAEPYLLSVGRICSIKRVDLIVRALPKIDERISLKIVGLPDEPNIEAFLYSEIAKHHLEHRVEFLGRVSDEALLSLYAKSFAVFYAPYDEDYGFVTLEALASGKPLITATDSGCVLQFVRHNENCVVVEPEEAAIASAVNELFADTGRYQQLCEGAYASRLDLSWNRTIERLTETIPRKK